MMNYSYEFHQQLKLHLYLMKVKSLVDLMNHIGMYEYHHHFHFLFDLGEVDVD
jgi:hypothetical protein